MTNPALGPGTRIGRFTIVTHVGGGGMGVVYRARDDGPLARDVALKFLLDELAGDPVARARLLGEARLAGGLSHPNICIIHDVCEDQGRDFIEMEFVDGRPLNVVAGGAGFATDAIVRIGCEIADALAHAHEHGVVHRDLKSANVMMTSEARVKVMDFGLARQVPSADSATVAGANASLTEPGAIVGTTRYMPPEVFAGAKADARGDIWALGVILYELAARELPFDGHTYYEVAAAILHSAPRLLPESVPIGLRTVIARCLEKEPARRYQRAGEVRAALEAVRPDSARLTPPPPPPEPSKRDPRIPVPRRPWLVPAILLCVVVAILIIRPWHWRPKPAKEASLAVLPLINLSGDPQQDYFAKGMTEEISTRLTQVKALRIIAQSSVARLIEKKLSPQAIGRALHVSDILQGSVVKDADSVRITVQLMKVESETLSWAESYRGSRLNVLSLQSDVALAIAHEIKVKLTPQEQTKLANRPLVDPEAYDAYLKGRAAFARLDEQGYQDAERLFRHAIEIAPDYAPAWAGLSDAIYEVSSLYVAANEAMPRSREAAEKALALDPNLAEAHTSFGVVKMVYDWDWKGAEREFDRAIELNPGNSLAHFFRGHLKIMLGRFDDGLADIRHALVLDPLSPWIRANLGWHLYHARRYDEALAHLRRAVAAEPDVHVYHVYLGVTLEQMGDHAGAVRELEEGVAGNLNNDSFWQLAHGYGTAGRRRDFDRVMSQMMARREQAFMPAANIALAYAGVAEPDSAFRWLDLAFEDHSETLVLLKVEAAFDPLRSDPRFDKVLRRIGLLD